LQTGDLDKRAIALWFIAAGCLLLFALLATAGVNSMFVTLSSFPEVPMKLLGQFLLVMALLSFPPCWGAQDQKPPEPPAPPSAGATWAGFDSERLLGTIDTDHDGKISGDEWARFFVNRDENKDSELDPDEVQPWTSRSNREQTAESDEGRLAALARLDGDRSGYLSRPEFPGNDKDFRVLDANRDGFISREEFLSRNGRWWNEPFENLDFNEDKIITRSEWLDSDASFLKLDRDRNGVIDRQEFYNPR
jgi:Ca2+-binding EF-hand superfamily protein